MCGCGVGGRGPASLLQSVRGESGSLCPTRVAPGREASWRSRAVSIAEEGKPPAGSPGPSSVFCRASGSTVAPGLRRWAAGASCTARCPYRTGQGPSSVPTQTPGAPSRRGTGPAGRGSVRQVSCPETRFSALLANAAPGPVSPVGLPVSGLVLHKVRIRSSQGFSAEGVLPPPSPGSRAAPAAEEAGGRPRVPVRTTDEDRGSLCPTPHAPSLCWPGTLWGTRGAQSAGDVPLGSSLLGTKGSSCRGETGWPHCVPEGHRGWGLWEETVSPLKPWPRPHPRHGTLPGPHTLTAVQALVPNVVAPGLLVLWLF